MSTATTRSTRELVETARAGDPEAITEIVRRYSGLVQASARAAGVDEQGARDAAQETWCTLLESLPSLRDPDRLGGWLTVVARRAAWRTDRARRREIPVDFEDTRPFGSAPAADADLLATEQARQLFAAVRSLPDRQRTVVAALAQDPPPSYAELSRATGLPIGGIGPTRGRALRALRGRLPAEPAMAGVAS